GRSYLLPSYYGFQRAGELVLNPSYQLFAAYRLFARVDDREFWNRICRDSLFLADAATFGKVKLPADWVVLDKKGIAPWKERVPLFGYEAIRVILHLSWEKKPVFPEGLKGLFALYRQKGRLPATIDLTSGAASAEEASAGFYAVCARAAARMGETNLSRQLWARALEKAATEKEQYYSTSLLLLAMHDVET
ncbi:MAG TPA: glycosyl hydrolase family 8, partial [Desulfuromonadaceae bacterium]